MVDWCLTCMGKSRHA